MTNTTKRIDALDLASNSKEKALALVEICDALNCAPLSVRHVHGLLAESCQEVADALTALEEYLLALAD